MTETNELIRKLTGAAFTASPDQLQRALHQLELKQPHREMLTAKESAPILGVCPATVKRYAKRGVLHAVKVSPRKMRFDREEIERLAAGGMAV